MTTQTEITQRNHHRAVRFFCCFLTGATLVSLVCNIAHAVLSYIPQRLRLQRDSPTNCRGNR